MIWMRESLALCRPIDAAIFDVDGVLIDDTVSYYAAVKATVAYVMQQHGRPATQGRLSDATLMAFKSAGGFNDDWVLAYTLSGLILAGAARDEDELKRIAGESAGRGMPWLRQRYFADLALDFDHVERIGIEHYWGAERLQEFMGLQPRYYAGPGFVCLEESLIPPGFFSELRAAGVGRFGIITGRNTAELRSAFQTLGFSQAHPFDFVLDSTELRKPDPRALQRAFDALTPAAALFIGDTGDDLQLTLNYRQRLGDTPPCVAAVVAKAGQRQHFQQAGADIVMDAVAELPAALRRLAAGPRADGAAQQ